MSSAITVNTTQLKANNLFNADNSAVYNSATTIWSLKGCSGQLPLGSVIAILPHLVGAYTCAATTVADASGFVLCNGQTISDATSPMNTAVIPNINDDVFLMGTVGVTNGAQASSNTKDFSHTHSVTVANHAKLIASDIPQVSTNYTPAGTNSASAVSGTTNIAHGHTVADGTHSHSLTSLASEYYGGADDSLGGPYAVRTSGGYVAGTTASASNVTVNALGTTNISLASGSAGAQAFTGTLTTITVGTAVGSQTQLSHSAATSTSALSAATDIRPKYIAVKYVMRIK